MIDKEQQHALLRKFQQYFAVDISSLALSSELGAAQRQCQYLTKWLQQHFDPRWDDIQANFGGTMGHHTAYTDFAPFPHIREREKMRVHTAKLVFAATHSVRISSPKLGDGVAVRIMSKRKPIGWRKVLRMGSLSRRWLLRVWNACKPSGLNGPDTT